MLLQRANSKLGEGIWTWSIPAGTTCPGATATCLKHCYALSGFFCMPNVYTLLEENLAHTEHPDFETGISSELRLNRVHVCRIHVAGDFYSPQYIRRWYRIVMHNPQVRFYAYTRSWRAAELLEVLRPLAELRNMNLFLSADRNTGRPPRVRGAGTCYMMVNDEDRPDYPVDLLFRGKSKTVLKRDGALVCPVGQGTDAKITCTSCGLCWKKNGLQQLRKLQREVIGV